MNRTNAVVSKALFLAVPLVAVVGFGAPRDAEAQYIAPPPPPPAYIATVQPEYFEGRPVYLYNGNWYYHEAHGWSYYRQEPQYLRDRRAHWQEHPRYHYHR
jgi:hypothetical protein